MKQGSMPSPPRLFRLLMISSIVPYCALLCQTNSNLVDPRLSADANIPQNDPPGVPIRQLLVNAHALAPSKGIVWKGLDIVIPDHEAVGPGTSVSALLQRQYSKQACKADAVVVGHVSGSAYHLSASGTGVYGDYLVVIDALLKDNAASSISSRPAIVVTRPGGSLSLPEGPANVVNEAFPLLEAGTTYLQFLRYIPQSLAFRALDPLSTLVANGSNWIIARKALAGFVVPGFARARWRYQSAIGRRPASSKEE